MISHALTHDSRNNNDDTTLSWYRDCEVFHVLIVPTDKVAFVMKADKKEARFTFKP